MIVATIVGRLTADPELRFLPSGSAMAKMCIVHTDRKKDEATGQWVDDGEPLFLNAVAWRANAEGAANTLSKGDLVTAIGKLKARSWEKDGVKRTGIEMTVDYISKDVKAGKSSVSAPGDVTSW